MREKGQTEVAKTLETPVFSRGIEILTEKNELVYGTERYNFEVHHYKNLSSPLEQAALAIAMATALEIEIRTKFPKDKSGTDITLDTKYVYTETHPNVTMTYIAENGNYKQLRAL